MPYKTTPSKKGNLPIGERNRQSGSGIFGKYRQIMASKATTAMLTVIKSRGDIMGFSIWRAGSLWIRGSFIIFFLSSFTSSVYGGVCHGKFVNPVTDICWKCVFPVTIMGIDVVKGKPSPKGSREPICFCKRPPLNAPLPGIPVGFWEPVRLVDVTRTPYCLVNMGGISVASSGVHDRGDVEENPADGTHHSFYQVHW